MAIQFTGKISFTTVRYHDEEGVEMHTPSVFREERLDVLHGLMTAYPLATLITSGSNGLMANLIPFTLHAGGEHGILRAHLARGNKQLDALRENGEALVVFQGPECYVTPSWYPSKTEHGKVVPTWNYAMVQVRGTPKVIDDVSWLRAQLEQLTGHLENRRAHPWKMSDAPDDYIAAQFNGIAGVEIPIRSIEGKLKLSQNRLPLDRQGVMDGIRAESACPAMLDLMKGS